jgi:hypothetical protein
MKKTIKHIRFSYYEEAPHPYKPGETILVEKIASQGETVEIPREEDIRIGEYHDAFYTKDELGAKQAHEDSPKAVEGGNFDEMGEHEIALYIEEKKPTINQLLELIGSDGDLADRVLDAEGIVTKGDPRKGLVSGIVEIKARNSE